MYIAQATIVRVKDGWTGMVQIPTFYLDENAQGIQNVTDAEYVVRMILNPLEDPEVTVNPNVFKVE